MSLAWSTLVPLAALCIPLVLALAAVLVSPRAPLRTAVFASALALVLGLGVAAAVGLGGSSLAVSGVLGLVRLDAVTAVMLVLVCTLAVVIGRYSRTYLRGEPGLRRYARALLATLSAVTVVVLANHLVIIALAWMGTSLALHQLLTFYPERTQALVAAHKKFMLSRLADVCTVAGLALLGLAVGSLGLDEVHAWARQSPELPLSAHVAAVLLVVAVSLRSAQIPFHGWLTQVMEAPTPVSALLHAGVVNIGGLLMIRLSPLMAQAPAAQVLLVVIGTVTVVIAALVMATRVSVKVSLAWSTCAQMGFMLVQCGLGAWHLALLHLVAHSLYKAHAFLGAGSTVDAWRVRAMAPRPPRVRPARVLTAGALAVAGAAAIGLGTTAALGGHAEPDPTQWPLAIILGLSLAPFLERMAASGWRTLASAAAVGGGVCLLYLGWHALASQVLVLPLASAASPVGWSIVLTGFVALFGLQVALQAWPSSRLARELGPRLFAGLYLDESFTRITFRLWPPTLPPREATPRQLITTKTVEA